MTEFASLVPRRESGEEEPRLVLAPRGDPLSPIMRAAGSPKRYWGAYSTLLGLPLLPLVEVVLVVEVVVLLVPLLRRDEPRPLPRPLPLPRPRPLPVLAPPTK